jgi:hypothetical protein
MGLRRLLTLMGIGAGLMYLYDPDQGNRRRAMLADQINSFKNNGQDFFAEAKRDLQNRRQGMQAEPITGGLGGLSGEWTPGVRLIAGLAGGGMTFYGLAKSGFSGIGATLLGLNLVSRSVFNRSGSGMPGFSEMADEMTGHSEGTKNASLGKRSSNGQGHGKARAGSTAGYSAQKGQSSGTNASLTSEQGARSASPEMSEPAGRTPMSGDVERDQGDQSVGFDSMLPGNPSEGSGQ